jgi:hypothetical protein
VLGIISAEEAYSVSDPRATYGPRDDVDWPDIYSWIIQFPVVSSDLPFGYSLDYK